MKYILILIILLILNTLNAQTNSTLNLTFLPTFNQEAVKINLEETQEEPTSIQLETFKCYISKVELFDGKTLVFEEEKSYHLLDVEEEHSLKLSLDLPKDISFSHIKFNVGIDSLTNMSGAFGGDLDPTNGMYWTWQSGYINFKLEGVAANCPARHHRFQYHIGGYQHPYNALQSIVLPIENQENININIELDKVFEQVDLENFYEVMSPNEKAIEFAQMIPTLFSVLK